MRLGDAPSFSTPLEPAPPSWSEPPAVQGSGPGVMQAFAAPPPPPEVTPTAPGLPPLGEPAPAAEPTGGEFSQLFRSLDAPGTPAARPAPPEPLSPMGLGSGTPAGFGRAPELPSDSYLDRLSAPSAPLGPPPSFPAAEGPGPVLPPLPSGFGATPAHPAPPPEPRFAPPAPPPTPAAAGTGLLIGIGVVVVLAVALVLYFALG